MAGGVGYATALWNFKPTTAPTNTKEMNSTTWTI
jgi:hypothetical protein